MPKKIGNATRLSLVTAPLPAATKTYTVISHEFIIDNAINLLNEAGFQVEKELYRSTYGAQVATGLFKLNYGGDPDLSLMFAFGNSYDKTMKFRSAIGAYVNSNDTVIINKFNDWDRKHTGKADQETIDTITTQVEKAAEYFDELKLHKDLMCNVNDIDRNKFASVVGQLYFNKFITVDQMSCILKEYDNPSFTYTLPNTNLWTCYNHILVALKRTHPKNWIENQIAVHLHICDHFDLLAYDDEQPQISGIPNGDTMSDTDDQDVIIDDKQYWEAYVDDVHGKLPEDGDGKVEEQTSNTVSFSSDDEEDFIDGVDEVIESPVEKETVTAVEDATSLFEKINTALQQDNDQDNLDDAAAEETPVVEESNEDTEDDVIYFDKNDYEDIEIGDYIEMDGMYYEVIQEESIEAGEFWLGKLTNLDTENASEESPVDTVPLSQEEIHAEIAEAEAAVSEVCDTDLNIEEPVVDTEVNEIPLQDQQEDKIDYVRIAIAEELEFIYDIGNPIFEYQLKGSNYNITLDSGETCTLSSNMITKKAMSHE